MKIKSILCAVTAASLVICFTSCGAKQQPPPVPEATASTPSTPAAESIQSAAPAAQAGSLDNAEFSKLIQNFDADVKNAAELFTEAKSVVAAAGTSAESVAQHMSEISELKSRADDIYASMNKIQNSMELIEDGVPETEEHKYERITEAAEEVTDALEELYELNLSDISSVSGGIDTRKLVSEVNEASVEFDRASKAWSNAIN